MNKIYCTKCDQSTDPEGGMIFTDDDGNSVEVCFAECPTCGAELSKTAGPLWLVTQFHAGAIDDVIADLLKEPDGSIVFPSHEIHWK